MTIQPFGPIDDIGPLLRDLAGSVEALQSKPRARLHGDLHIIAAAAVALTSLANEIARENQTEAA